MNFDQKALQRVYREITEATGIKRPVGPEVKVLSVAPKRLKFFKVYRAPGYPVEPKNDQARALDGYLNAFSPQPPNTFDSRPFHDWLLSNIN